MRWHQIPYAVAYELCKNSIPHSNFLSQGLKYADNKLEFSTTSAAQHLCNPYKWWCVDHTWEGHDQVSQVDWPAAHYLQTYTWVALVHGGNQLMSTHPFWYHLPLISRNSTCVRDFSSEYNCDRAQGRPSTNIWFFCANLNFPPRSDFAYVTFQDQNIRQWHASPN